MNKPFKKGIYQHYKGKYYQVLDVAHHSETMEELVAYRALYTTEYGTNALWVRPRTMFFEDVVIDGKTMPRFRYVCRSKKVIPQ